MVGGAVNIPGSGGHCPNCGYCPHCGRSNQPSFQPYWGTPVTPINPWWVQPSYPTYIVTASDNVNWGTKTISET